MGLSLQDIMNDVSAHIVGTAVPAITEMQAFLQIDPLLAGFHKEYLDAQCHRQKAEKDFGKDDPMTDMAMLVEDSAWCAMQTRYMELRADRLLMKRAQELMEEARLLEHRKREDERARAALWNYHQMEMMMEMRKKDEAKTLAIWWALMMLLYDRGNVFVLHQPTHQFNRLAA